MTAIMSQGLGDFSRWSYEFVSAHRQVLSEIQYALGEKRFRGRLVGVLAGRTAANSIPWALDLPVDARQDPAKAARQVARLLEGKGKRALVRGEASA